MQTNKNDTKNHFQDLKLVSMKNLIKYEYKTFTNAIQVQFIFKYNIKTNLIKIEEN